MIIHMEREREKERTRIDETKMDEEVEIAHLENGGKVDE